MSPSGSVQTALLYHFCRLRLPAVALPLALFEQQLRRAFQQFEAKRAKVGATVTWDAFVDNLYTLDWFVACACLEGQQRAWEFLFASRASRTDTLLVDALRMRAVRLFPRNEEQQDNAVSEFWGFLLAGERDGSLPILARYDGQRPLVPWLIRVFQNKHLSDLRQHKGVQALPDDDLDERDLSFPGNGAGRWHEEFRVAARDWLAELPDKDVLILGLRLRYRLSQRDVASLLTTDDETARPLPGTDRSTATRTGLDRRRPGRVHFERNGQFASRRAASGGGPTGGSTGKERQEIAGADGGRGVGMTRFLL
jgi:hypothetical protein